MAKLLKLRRGTTTQHASFTGAEGELTVDITKDTAVVHDGSQAGGRPLAREDMSNVSSASIAGRLGTDSIAVDKIAGGTLPSDVKVITANINDSQINNAKIGANAAIAGTKISPAFGSQNISTTGTVSTGDVTLTGAAPKITLLDSNDNPDYLIQINGGNFLIHDATNSSDKIKINADGHVDINGNLDVSSGVDVTGDITATGNLQITNVNPNIKLYDSNNDSDFQVQNDNGNFNVRDTTNSANRLRIDATGGVNIPGNTDFGAGIDVTGNITATGTVDGRDVAADGTKLDGIESGATADQTKSDIDALNINADLLDGNHGNEFLRSNTADTADGDITFNGGAGAVMINNGSDIRLQQDSSNWTGDYGAKIQHHSNALYIQGGSSGHYLRNPSGSNVVSIDTNGNLTATGNVTAYSDARLKTDIHTINDALSICGKLRGVSYKWIADGKAGIGVIAQEVEEVIPEVVLTKLDPNPATGEETEVKSVDYGKIVGVLINAINELKEEVEELKNAKIT